MLPAWKQAFDAKIKSKPFEQFGLLLCDLETCVPAQRELLRKILFDDCSSAHFWSDYINFTIEFFPERKLQLQRLVNKAIEVLNEADNKDNRQYTNLHLQSMKLKR